ncbi:hypothetical protein N7448_007899 [Penicillium atrosanguineum]|uniref:Uncharacterized protein n=1 Tax=Penicillium atrosanguineum TaxID=1132637 RepID=A0A9W9QCZ9_9EURO|nr:uncharacterized protein N7443_001079 [Penicillium atrosanguineum]KAJ5127120.1 hypothetical protein N7448_007899 [Penicillium atrosanguineum]KAJ5147326.1 hypothetical protein N7526_000678 [Penicillium atrosanguineum]KAJ5314195.1 hypothetical protein N7443_001079 [Penicillium atrosanguineum]KAJ5331362.1 hypothetical protein N7476_001145 [Penicillium atrosanguineum]
MSDSVDRVFVHALNTVKRIPRTGTARPPAAERLKLYGLYKQSMEGDVDGVMDRPIGNTSEVHAECEKWDAWYAQRGLTRTEAKRRYIGTLIDTMHQYASQTPEARELVSELEFVWDQIKYNASSSSSSSPLHAVGVPPLSRHQGSSYGSIGGRLAGSTGAYDRPNRVDDGRDSRLRVLSPVSQPEEEEYYRRRRSMDVEDQAEVDDDEEDEEYEEARDSLYEEADAASTNADLRSETEHTSHSHDPRHQPTSGDSASGVESQRHSRHDSHDVQPKDSRWRRRVEQALTKMTAEIAAVREQMESRTLAHRRRSGVWAWLKWILWTVMRQIVWDLALLGVILIVMRVRGDRRLENRLRDGWQELKARLGRFKLLKRVGDAPLLP